MKTFAYAEDTVAFFKFLKRYPPNRIYSDKFCQVIFGYRDFYFVAETDSGVAVSQDGGGEVLFTEFKRIDSIFEPSTNHELIFQSQAIDRLWIIRTLLYYTDYVIFDSEAEAIGDFKIKTKADEVIADLMKKSSRAREQIVCHRDSNEAKGIDSKFTNLVDAGIMLEIESQLLMCFSWCNGFGVVGDTMSNDEIKEDVAPCYKFIEV